MVFRVNVNLCISIILFLFVYQWACITVIAHPPLSMWNYRELRTWKKLRREAEAMWKNASKMKDSQGIRKAHDLYYQAYIVSEKNDTESFYDYAYTSAVGCIYQNYPSRDAVRSALALDLDEIDTIVPWVRPDPTFYRVLPLWTMEPVPLGVTPISQLVAMTMLDSRSLYHVTRAWASAFQFPGPHPIDISSFPDYSLTQISIEEDQDPIQTALVSNQLPPIRILYFSIHFGDHPVGHHIGTLLRLHNRKQFTVICVFTGNTTTIGNNITNLDSPILQRNAEYCDEWITSITADVQLKDAYRILKQLQPDIIVTLDGYDRGHRMDILSATPNLAFTINYFGFLSTLGADYVQGIIGDETTIPKNKDYEILYREPYILRHPVSFFVTDYQTMHPEVLIQPPYTYSTESIFTFCSFSQLFKVSPDLLQTWLRILERTTVSALPTEKQSRLLLPDHPPVGKDNLLYYIQNYYKPQNPIVSVESLIARIEFIPILPRDEHIVYKRQRCTVGLDTPYYNGHTSTADLLYAGVPVLTIILPNSTMAGRAAASLVRATRGPEVFITYNYLEYETTALNVYNAYQRTIGQATVEGTIATSTAEEEEKEVHINEQGDTLTEPIVNTDNYLWRPTFDAPLFQREQWVNQFEEEVRKTYFSYLKEFKPNNPFFKWTRSSSNTV